MQRQKSEVKLIRIKETLAVGDTIVTHFREGDNGKLVIDFERAVLKYEKSKDPIDGKMVLNAISIIGTTKEGEEYLLPPESSDRRSLKEAFEYVAGRENLGTSYVVRKFKDAVRRY